MKQEMLFMMPNQLCENNEVNRMLIFLAH